MKNYKIILKSTGSITQLPDSQKVFGALVTMFAEVNGNAKATELVKDVLNKKIHLALSNIIPLDYFPMPQDYIMDMLVNNTQEGKSLKEQRAKVKERVFVKFEGLKSVLKDPKKCGEIYPYIKQSEGQQLRASIESVIYGIEGLETKLYTVPVLKLQEVKQCGKEKKIDSVSKFYFYLQGDESECFRSVLDLIKELLKSGTALILGKRASQGLNKYQVTVLESIELPNAKYYLNLGMLLPDKIEFCSSTLKLFTSERRPFAMPGGWNQNYSKSFISFIDSGSIIALQNGIEQAGKSVPSSFNKDRDIVFGNAFLYPIDLGKGEEG